MRSAKRITLVDCGSVKTKHIAAILAGCACVVDIVPLKDANRHAFDASDAALISGGPLLFTESGAEQTLLEKFDFVIRLETPCLGICLGHQAIGLQNGARIYLGEERRSAERIRIETEHPLFIGVPRTVTLREDHCEGIELPEGFERLASSGAYPVEAMADDDKRLYGVQFHPEVSGQFGVRVLQNFVTRICS